MSIEQVDNYDTDGIMKRAAQPEELATCSCSGLTLSEKLTVIIINGDIYYV